MTLKQLVKLYGPLEQLQWGDPFRPSSSIWVGADKNDGPMRHLLLEPSPVPILPPLCFLVDAPAAMDNGDNLVVYARVMLSEKVAYLQAKSAMHHAHERAVLHPASFRTPSSFTPARFFQRRPPTFKLRWRCT
ncbi:hypothetical protein D1007_02273 [Hordeum vulgare]|nr:hypothetical protein D1007_02273 [Hordeum vulgare]